INIAVEENIVNDIRVGSQKALNIFRIVQEAIHNALKHSHAKNIIVEIKTGDVISIIIKDDGTGITSTADSAGHGLRNMKIRAEDAGIHFNIESAEGSGTNIFLETA
ncbi:MAG: sensor histidine kinase, partial [Parafilimonas sp.]